jgi:hypothetical protein
MQLFSRKKAQKAQKEDAPAEFQLISKLFCPSTLNQ